jgi:hypothetical protein
MFHNSKVCKSRGTYKLQCNELMFEPALCNRNVKYSDMAYNCLVTEDSKYVHADWLR